MAFTIDSVLIPRRAMRKGDMPVCDIVEEMDLFLLQGQCGADGMDGRIAPAFIEEAAVLVELVEEVEIGIGTQPVEIADFEVGPLDEALVRESNGVLVGLAYEMAVIVGFAVVVAQPVHGIAFGYVLGMFLHESLGTIPKRWNCLHIFVEADHEAVLFPIISHELERVVGDIAIQLDTWFNAPIPLIVVHDGLAEEEARLESAHVPVALGVSVDDLSLRHVFSDFARLLLVDKFGV